jgi:hypothetical protein
MGFFDNQKDDHRRDEMAALARSMNTSFEAEDATGLIGLLKGFQMYARWNRSQKLKHVIRMDDAFLETRLLVFDHYVTKQANNTRILEKQTVYFIQSKKLGLPEILLQPEDLFQKIAIFFGRQDINFEAFPEFSRSYRLKGDPELVRDTFNANILNFFTVEKDWTMEGLNYYLIFYRKKQLIDTEQIRKDIVNLTNLLKDLEAPSLKLKG